MYHHVLRMYQYVLDTGCTSMYLVFQIKQIRGQTWLWLDPAELNHILAAHVVDSAVTTFGCVEWESQLFLGVMSARCYPFN
jgi:hypothetical protein